MPMTRTSRYSSDLDDLAWVFVLLIVGNGIGLGLLYGFACLASRP